MSRELEQIFREAIDRLEACSDDFSVSNRDNQSVLAFNVICHLSLQSIAKGIKQSKPNDFVAVKQNLTSHDIEVLAGVQANLRSVFENVKDGSSGNIAPAIITEKSPMFVRNEQSPYAHMHLIDEELKQAYKLYYEYIDTLLETPILA